MKNISRKVLEERRAALLKRLAQVGPFVQASFCTRKVICGKPGCRCAEGEPHQACVLTRKVRGKTKATHVPRDLREEVRAWAEEHKRVKALMSQISELSEQIVRIHVGTSRAADRNRDRASRTRPSCTEPCCDTTSQSS